MSTQRIVPLSVPKISRDEALELLEATFVKHASDATLLFLTLRNSAPVLLGLRGYYLDTMGAPGANDRGIYDDAIVLLSPTTFTTFNANTDPARHRVGIANLAEGVWWYKLGTHNLSKPATQRYEALVQAEKVTVLRDNVITSCQHIEVRGTQRITCPWARFEHGSDVSLHRFVPAPPRPDTGFFGINIHRGGNTVTSSLGCQTIPPPQWPSFIALVKSEMKRHNQKRIAYALTVRKEVKP